MKSARRTLVSRIGTLVPVIALAATATVVAVSGPRTAPGSESVPVLKPASFADRGPIGKLERIYQVPGGVRAVGWAFDPDAPTQSINAFSGVDRKFTNQVVASQARKDVAAAHPNAGAAHGFTIVVPASEGLHDVCILAKNVGAGRNVTLGCLNDTVLDYGPYGAIDAIDTRPGAIHVKGWLIDDDEPTAPVTARIGIDGVLHTLVANRSRPDIDGVSATGGTKHGYEATYAVPQGTHSVCIAGTNIGYGSNNRIDCRTVTVNDNPFGKINSIGQSAASVRIRGWALDRDKPTTAVAGYVRVDGGRATAFSARLTRTDVAKSFPGTGSTHGFDLRIPVGEGTHSVCVTLRNIGFGKDASFSCRTVTVAYTPTAALHTPVQSRTGMTLSGWATDPDTAKPVSVRLTVDGRTVTTVLADDKGSSHDGRNFTTTVAARSGKHTVCAIALNIGAGTHNSAPTCRTVTLAMNPIGAFETLTRSGDDVVVTGWAYDPDTTASASVVVSVDGKLATTVRASGTRTDVAKRYPSAGSRRGFSSVVTATDAEHTVCLSVVNVGGGTATALGCRLIIAVNPVAPSAPRSVKATSGFGSSVVSWSPPASDGGAPATKYTVVASPGGVTVTVGATATSATVSGLKGNTLYTFAVRAVNVAGSSVAGVSAAVRTQTGPAPQKTPAPISTSRYIRNIRTCSAAEKTVMTRFGAADAKANPAGHKYLMLLDIGGQSQTYGGVVLSATTRFVTYAALLSCSKAYVDGYAGAQRSAAPAMVAIGVNNDMDVNAATGRDWATKIVNPLVSYARKYAGITIAGANDIEPGFSASYAATRNWVTGYLAATKAKFVFNGSADGCAWTVTNRSCNNGWTMAGLYNLAGGAAPTRIINLPQVYNYTMADQWKYISLTGIGQGKPRINFGGPLTEYTACAQARSCGSIGGVSAWKRMWTNLQSHPELRVGSLPYATDLRIDS